MILFTLKNKLFTLGKSDRDYKDLSLRTMGRHHLMDTNHGILLGSIVTIGGDSMLFDISPKGKVGELFGREEELTELKQLVEKYPIVSLIGVRRVGKTSILKTFLGITDLPYILIDLRECAGTSHSISHMKLLKAFENSFNILKDSWDKIASILKNIKGISLMGTEIRFDPKTGNADLGEILDALEKGCDKKGEYMIIAFDEAQYLRFFGSRGGAEIRRLLAHTYDYHKRIKFILTGSEIGLLHDFLRQDDPESELFGRYISEMTIIPFTKEKSIEFLKRGFEEYEFKIDEEDILRAVQELDGIVGWLVVFGNSVIQKGISDSIFTEVFDMASNMIKEELSELKVKSPRYITLLRAVATGLNRWSTLKRYLEAIEGPITDARFQVLLNNLIRYSWIEQREDRYYLIDPVIEKVLKRSRI